MFGLQTTAPNYCVLEMLGPCMNMMMLVGLYISSLVELVKLILSMSSDDKENAMTKLMRCQLETYFNIGKRNIIKLKFVLNFN